MRERRSNHLIKTVQLFILGTLFFHCRGIAADLEGSWEPFCGATCSTIHASTSVHFTSANPQGALRFVPPQGKHSFDLSQGKYLAVDLRNESPSHQMRLTFHASVSGTESAHHAVALLAQNKSINTGIALNPGEQQTLRLFLPHHDIDVSPTNAYPRRTIQTRAVDRIELKLQWPFEEAQEHLVSCTVSRPRLEGTPAKVLIFPENEPFIDAYGQFIHEDWPEKIHSDEMLSHDLMAEEKALRAAPSTWDAWGGWRTGPTCTATGFFRTEKVNGKWWLVTPDGHLFFSTGIDVLRLSTDSSDGSKHPSWYRTPVPRGGRMDFARWNVQKKFGLKDPTPAYCAFLLKRLPAWGMNTIGNWSEPTLLQSKRMPYVASVLELDRAVPQLKGIKFYDCFHPAFEQRMKSAILNAFEKRSDLRASIQDPFCIGYFIDNELNFNGAAATVSKGLTGEAKRLRKKAFWSLYFCVCQETLRELAPHHLYLGPRFIGFHQSPLLWETASTFCDVITCNCYAHSVAQVPQTIYGEKGIERPLLVGEFHFGCFDRGMFSAGLCPVENQAFRAHAYTRFLEGALSHPLIVGCHWFQYRDQPLIGRSDGEAYQIGFVDGCDRPYTKLVLAARTLAEKMYPLRALSTHACKSH